MAEMQTRRQWLKRTAAAASVLPVVSWYNGLESLATPNSIQDQPAIRLNSNENPYGPGPMARKAILDALSEANRYPRNAIKALTEAIAAREGVTTEHIFITAGSTELLGLAGLAYGLPGGELVSCDPTFDFLLLYAERIGCEWKRTPLTNEQQFDLNALSAQTGKNTRLIFICNPNNPTGVEIPTTALRDFCISHSRDYSIFIDEAYIELSPNGRNSSMVSLIKANPNIIIGRTFSKIFGLAGMRIGYAVAHPSTIRKLENFHIGRMISVSNLAAAAAHASLQDNEFENLCRQKIIAERISLMDFFKSKNIHYLHSAGNFLCFENSRFPDRPLKLMEKENILVRDYRHFPDWTRVSIGTTEDMNAFKAAVEKYVV